MRKAVICRCAPEYGSCEQVHLELRLIYDYGAELVGSVDCDVTRRESVGFVEPLRLVGRILTGQLLGPHSEIRLSSSIRHNNNSAHRLRSVGEIACRRSQRGGGGGKGGGHFGPLLIAAAEYHGFKHGNYHTVCSLTHLAVFDVCFD